MVKILSSNITLFFSIGEQTSKMRPAHRNCSSHNSPSFWLDLHCRKWCCNREKVSKNDQDMSFSQLKCTTSPATLLSQNMSINFWVTRSKGFVHSISGQTLITSLWASHFYPCGNLATLIIDPCLMRTNDVLYLHCFNNTKFLTN
jgi:hypothetical protein